MLSGLVIIKQAACSLLLVLVVPIIFRLYKGKIFSQGLSVWKSLDGSSGLRCTEKPEESPSQMGKNIDSPSSGTKHAESSCAATCACLTSDRFLQITVCDTLCLCYLRIVIHTIEFLHTSYIDRCWLRIDHGRVKSKKKKSI